MYAQSLGDKFSELPRGRIAEVEDFIGSMRIFIHWLSAGSATATLKQQQTRCKQDPYHDFMHFHPLSITDYKNLAKQPKFNDLDYQALLI